MEKTTGQRFKDIRIELRLSQEEMGLKIGLSKSAVSAVENDKSFMSIDVLRTLFMDLKVNINFLISGIGEPFVKSGAEQFKDIREDILKEVDKMLKDRGI